ncbi:MAG: D-alanyl-D-alanine carboxypeptidase family protein [Acidimicrobiales bacterium]
MGALQRVRSPRGVAVIGLAALTAVVISAPWRVAPTGAQDTTTTVGATTTTTTSVTTTTAPIGAVTTPLPWPSKAGAAASIPQLSVVAAAPVQNRRPIASLTKMMTTWVVLHALPLSLGQSGPCVRVSRADVKVYENDVNEGQSSIDVAVGERLCESSLLRGMLVHSAGNFAVMLEEMMGVSGPAFVAMMNSDAKALGLTRTHYVDATGIDPRDTSTALDQVTMVGDLMTAESVVRADVRLLQVTLPVGGVQVSYTPYVGQFGVVGVKSGYTIPAGGCDAMAVNFHVKGKLLTAYAVVLGVQGAEAIDRAGLDALGLARALRRHVAAVTANSTTTLEWTGQPGNVVATTTTTTVAPTTTTTG